MGKTTEQVRLRYGPPGKEARRADGLAHTGTLNFREPARTLQGQLIYRERIVAVGEVFETDPETAAALLVDANVTRIDSQEAN